MSHISSVERENWPDYYMGIARQVASRSTCPRAQVGAVITVNNRIVATGYNGSPSGMEHCTDVGCKMHAGHCIRTIHAEMNAIFNAVADLRGGRLYTTHMPCHECSKALIQVGIAEVWSDQWYFDNRIGDDTHPLLTHAALYVNKQSVGPDSQVVYADGNGWFVIQDTY